MHWQGQWRKPRILEYILLATLRFPATAQHMDQNGGKDKKKDPNGALASTQGAEARGACGHGEQVVGSRLEHEVPHNGPNQKHTQNV